MRMTVGPLPATVYWRRRVVVLGAVLLLVVLTVWSCGGSDGTGQAGRRSHGGNGRSDGAPPTSGPGSRSASATPSPSATATGSPVPSGEPNLVGGETGPLVTGPAPRCADSDLVVTTRTHPRHVPMGSYPTLYLTIRNRSGHACTRNIGADEQELWITEGSKRLWSSNDCGANHGKDVRRFEPGNAVTFHRVWNSRTSSKGCEGARDLVGRGTYQLRGRVGGRKGKPSDFTVT